MPSELRSQAEGQRLLLQSEKTSPNGFHTRKPAQERHVVWFQMVGHHPQTFVMSKGRRDAADLDGLVTKNRRHLRLSDMSGNLALLDILDAKSSPRVSF